MSSDVAARKESDVRTMKEKLQEDIEQMKEKQKLTELKVSAVETEFERSTKRGLYILRLGHLKINAIK